MAVQTVENIADLLMQTTGANVLELSNMMVLDKINECMGLCECVMKEKKEIESKFKGIQILYWQEVENLANERMEKNALQLELANLKELLKKEQNIVCEIAEENEQLKQQVDLNYGKRIDEMEAMFEELVEEKAILQKEREAVMKIAEENEKFKIEQAESELLETETWPQPELEEVVSAEKELLRVERDIAKKISEENEKLKIEQAEMEEDLKRLEVELSEKASSDIIELKEKIEEISLEKENLEKLVAELREQSSTVAVYQPPRPAASVQPVFVLVMPIINAFFVTGVDSNENHRLAFENDFLAREKMALLESLEIKEEEIEKLEQELKNAKKNLQLYKVLIPFDFIQDEETVTAPDELL